jgi:hypothetical protein
MPRVADRVYETTTTTGTGDITTGGAVAGAQTFNTAFGIGPFFYYCIALGAEWEVGIGHLSGSTTLVRDAVLKSSNANALVSFSAGAKDVFCQMPAAFAMGAGLGRSTMQGIGGNGMSSVPGFG